MDNSKTADFLEKFLKRNPNKSGLPDGLWVKTCIIRYLKREYMLGDEMINEEAIIRKAGSGIFN